MMKAQKRLFDIIRSGIPEQYRLVDVIEESLKVSTDSAYRRIRGDKELSFSELQKLCHTFHLSMDELLNCDSEQNVLFRYTLVIEQQDYIRYIEQLSKTLGALAAVEDRELYFTAQDIPFYHFLPHEELLFFRLYVWYDSTTPERISFREFYSRMDMDVCSPFHEQLLREYLRIPSKEIWTDQTVNTILRLLDFYMEIGAFDSRETALLLLRQLTELLDRVNRSAEAGYKDVERRTPFALYNCSVNPGSNMVLIRRDGRWICTVKLYTVNNVTTNNIALNGETRKWINNLILKSTLISGGTSERERIRFFQTLKDKVETLTRKVEQSASV